MSQAKKIQKSANAFAELKKQWISQRKQQGLPTELDDIVEIGKNEKDEPIKTTLRDLMKDNRRKARNKRKAFKRKSK